MQTAVPAASTARPGRRPCMHLGADTPVWRQGAAPCGNVLLVRQGILRLERGLLVFSAISDGTKS
jgi:hypothetical protein